MILKNYDEYFFTKETPSILNNLLFIQKFLFNSTFLRKNNYLDKIFFRYFPIYSKYSRLKICYCGYFLKKKITDLDYCKKFYKTKYFSLYIRIKFLFFYNEKNKNFISKLIYKNIYFCDIPIMTNNCSFLINGIERTIVSQLYKNPSISIERIKNYDVIRVIPLYGIWLEFYRDKYRNISLSLNNSKKIPIFYFLILINFPLSYLIKLFSFYSYLLLKDGKIYILFYKGIYKLSKRYKKSNLNKINKKYYLEIKSFLYKYIYYIDAYKKNIFLNLEKNFNIFLKKYKNFNGLIKCIITKNCNKIFVSCIENYYNLNIIKEFYNISGISKTSSFNNFLLKRKKLFFSEKFFYLTSYSRIKLNKIIGSFSSRNFIDYNDIYNLIFFFINNKKILSYKIDKDSLSNKKIRGSGKQIENIFNNKIFLLKKIILKRISKKNIKTSFYLFNNKIITHSINEFFCVSQYCQFLDQNNILSEITHKRRISSISKNSCLKGKSMEVLREIHYTSYGRICPIETPEGLNIGLVNSYSLFSNLDYDYFINTPFIKIFNFNITGKIIYLKSEIDTKNKICSFNNILNINKINKFGIVRLNKKILYDTLDNVKFLDVSTLQIFSLASTMIPFLEHDDLNRALMGSNMQRQSVTGFIKSLPYVSTGLEYIPLIDLNYSFYIINKRIIYQDSKNIIITKKNNKILVFKIIDFYKYKYNNQKNIVNNNVHDLKKKINKDLCFVNDNQNTHKGFMSLGHNVITCFLSFKGYNYEDSIIISDRLSKSEYFSTLHYSTYVMKFKYSKNIKYDKKMFYIDKKNYKKISKNGFPKIGMNFEPGEIIVARVIKKNDFSKSGCDNLINVLIKNKKINYYQDFVRIDNNCSGTLYKIDYIYSDYYEEIDGNFSRKINKCYKIILKYYVKEKFKYFKKKYKKYYYNFYYNKKFYYLGKNNININIDIIIANNRIYNINKFIYPENSNLKKLKEIRFNFIKKKKLSVGDKMSGRHGNKGVISKILPIENMPYLKDGTICDMILNPLGVPTRMNVGQIFEINLGLLIFGIIERIKIYIRNRKINNIKSFLKCLNFSFKNFKKNIYDIEYYKKNITISCLPFRSINNFEIIKLSKKVFNNSLIKKFGINKTFDKVDIFDGYNGLKIENKVTFGYMYFLKLHHTSYDKIHARSIGPYSLITQQPLKGKSKMGGQRIGEMETWAFEAYGAAYILREMLTVKSDDMISREINYKNIIFGKKEKMNFFPESFNILVNELKSLCINLELL
ncbi:DNA-directed RNA polymerase subunit beta [Candidatus Vidania fulgoroideorum]